MKKRMFLTTVLMALVLLMAVATATFAWYAASTEGNFEGVGDKVNVTTSDKTYQVGELKITVKFGTPSNFTNLGPVASDGTVEFTTGEGRPNITIPATTSGATNAYYETLGSVEWTLSVQQKVGTDEEGKEKLADVSAEELAAYAGTKFTITFEEQNSKLRLSDNKPSSNYVTGTLTSISYTVEISNNGKLCLVEKGAITEKVLSGGDLYVSVVDTYTGKIENGNLVVDTLTLKADIAEVN